MTTGRSVGVRTAITASIIALGIAACSGGGNSTATTTTTTEAPPASVAFGTQLASDYLNFFDASEFGDIELERIYSGERERLPTDAEAPYADQIRADPSLVEAGVALDRFSDDALLYLGYMYCLFRDVDAPPEVAIQAVVAVPARSAGREPTDPAFEDLVAGVTVANYASGSLCPEYFDDTREFIDSLSG